MESRYAARYAARYGRRYGTGMAVGGNGASSAAVRGGRDCGTWVSDHGAHGRDVQPSNAPTVCEAKPPRCDCHVLGTNSLNVIANQDAGLGLGVPSGAFGVLLLDTGDAGYFVPYYMAIFAFEADPAGPGVLGAGAGGTPLVVNLQDSKSGREPNMRRASETDPSFGVATLIYGQEKELECVDWRQFSSTNNQQMSLTFYNPNSVPVHIFVDMWGLPAA